MRAQETQGELLRRLAQEGDALRSVQRLEGSLGYRVDSVIDVDLVVLEAFVDEPGGAPVVDHLLHRHGLFPLEHQLALILDLLAIDGPGLGLGGLGEDLEELAQGGGDPAIGDVGRGVLLFVHDGGGCDFRAGRQVGEGGLVLGEDRRRQVKADNKQHCERGGSQHAGISFFRG